GKGEEAKGKDQEAKGQGQAEQDQAAAATPEAAEPSAIPKPEAAFLDVVKLYARRYEAADNEAKKQELRQQRRAALQQALQETLVHDWIGSVESVKSDAAGRLSVQISLPDSKV